MGRRAGPIYARTIRARGVLSAVLLGGLGAGVHDPSSLLQAVRSELGPQSPFPSCLGPVEPCPTALDAFDPPLRGHPLLLRPPPKQGEDAADQQSGAWPGLGRASWLGAVTLLSAPDTCPTAGCTNQSTLPAVFFFFCLNPFKRASVPSKPSPN